MASSADSSGTDSTWYATVGKPDLERILTRSAGSKVFDESILQILDLLPIEQRQGFAQMWRFYCDQRFQAPRGAAFGFGGPTAMGGGSGGGGGSGSGASAAAPPALAPESPAPDAPKIMPPSPASILDIGDLEPCPDDAALQHELLDKLVVLKLNGGLGLTMGCKGPKSGIEVRQDLSFLDLVVRQVEYTNTAFGVDVPLVLMNSFNTHEETVNIIHKYRQHNLTIHTFNQSCYPYIFRESLQPVPARPFDGDEDEREFWYPPGHGDVFSALFQSGLLENLVDQGKEYIFISNVDNLGATVDLDIIFHLMNSGIEFLGEVTRKTKRESEIAVGGHVLAEVGGRLTMAGLERITSASHTSKTDLLHYNTNNLWVSLRSIQRLVAQDIIKMDVTVNELSVHGMPVVQLERAAGTAMQHFAKSAALNVPRIRFVPVKSTADLFLLQSDLYHINHGCLQMRAERAAESIPVVKFSHEFDRLEDYWARIPRGMPNVIRLEQLTVSGDVWFGSGVTLHGTVIIVANEGARIDVPDGTILQDKVVTGDLRIFEH